MRRDFPVGQESGKPWGKYSSLAAGASQVPERGLGVLSGLFPSPSTGPFSTEQLEGHDSEACVLTRSLSGGAPAGRTVSAIGHELCSPTLRTRYLLLGVWPAAKATSSHGPSLPGSLVSPGSGGVASIRRGSPRPQARVPHRHGLGVRAWPCRGSFRSPRGSGSQRSDDSPTGSWL